MERCRTERLDAARPSDVARAAAILRGGGTVAFPTETVYGLGANALDAAAVEKIFMAKQRPHWDPLIVHVANVEMLREVCWEATEGEPRRVAKVLMEHFWPGPLTLLLPRTPAIPDAVTAGRALVGVRMPAHPVALELIRQAGVPIAAPSANTFGHTSPTTAAHVLADLDGRIDAVLDGGPTTLGLESTVAEPVRDGVIVYRPGGANLAGLSGHIDVGWVRNYEPPATVGVPESLPSPGVGIRHYAPLARVMLVAGGERELVDAIDHAFDGQATLGVMLPEHWNSSCAQLPYRWGDWHQPEMLARRLYAGLRELDDRGATVILVPLPESGSMAEAIRDRLRKAAR